MQQIVRTIALAYNNLPRPHRVMLGSLTVVTLAVAVWRPFVYHPEHNPIAKSVELESSQMRSLLPEASEPIDADQPTPDDEIPQDELDQKDAGDDGVHEYVVSTGDTLGSILTQYGIDMSDVTLLASQNRDLRNLKIGQQLSWTVNDAGDLQQLTWEVSRRETRTYDRVGNSFKESKEAQQGEWRNNVISGRVNGSFVSSAGDAGLSRNEINSVIKALQWQLDFRKLRKGDQFSVLMSREHFDGKKSQSQLLGVRLRTGGKDYYAIRAEDGKFYDRQGSRPGARLHAFPDHETVPHLLQLQPAPREPGDRPRGAALKASILPCRSARRCWRSATVKW